jgi:hypothetical protein
MPYIKPDARMKFDEGINSIIDALKQNVNSDEQPNMGELNYVISSIVWELFKDSRSYSTGNALVGVLECVKQEFIRRKLNEYEDEKIEENGDL